VGGAHDAEAVGVGHAALDHGVDAGHDVAVVVLAPAVDDHALAGFAVAGSAARHREEDRVAGAGEGFGGEWVDLPYGVHELREEAVGDAAAGAAVDVDEHRQAHAARLPVGRSEEQTPDLHAVEGAPAHRLELAEGELAQLRVDLGEPRRLSRRGVHDEDIAHGAAFDGAVREALAVAAQRQRVVDGDAGGDLLWAAAVDRHAHDRLLEHLAALAEGAVVGVQVDGAAVARPYPLVHPRVAERQDARLAGLRGSQGRHGEAARRHDVEAAVAGDEGDPAAVGRDVDAVVEAGAVDDRPQLSTRRGDGVDTR